jgi:hypothetical protein
VDARRYIGPLPHRGTECADESEEVAQASLAQYQPVSLG